MVGYFSGVGSVRFAGDACVGLIVADQNYFCRRGLGLPASSNASAEEIR